MRVTVNIPLHLSREYLDDVDLDTIPETGDLFGEMHGHEYIVEKKTIANNECILDVRRKDFCKQEEGD